MYKAVILYLLYPTHFLFLKVWDPYTFPASKVRLVPASQESLQRIVGAYLAAVERYSEIVPRAFLEKTLPEIEKS